MIITLRYFLGEKRIALSYTNLITYACNGTKSLFLLTFLIDKTRELKMKNGKFTLSMSRKIKWLSKKSERPTTPCIALPE